MAVSKYKPSGACKRLGEWHHDLCWCPLLMRDSLTYIHVALSRTLTAPEARCGLHKEWFGDNGERGREEVDAERPKTPRRGTSRTPRIRSEEDRGGSRRPAPARLACP
jgi:hypothetical protein